MAYTKHVVKNANVLLGDYSFGSNAVDASLSYRSDAVDSSGFGKGWKSAMSGVKSWTVNLTLLQNFSDNSINEKLWNWATDGDSIEIEVSGEDNSFSGTIVFTGEIPVFSGRFGEVSGGSVTLQGTGVLTIGIPTPPSGSVWVADSEGLLFLSSDGFSLAALES